MSGMEGRHHITINNIKLIRRYYRYPLKLISYSPYFRYITPYLSLGVASIKEYITYLISIYLLLILFSIFAIQLLNISLFIIVPILLIGGITIYIYLPRLYLHILRSSLDRDLERERILLYLVFSLYSRRFSLERIFQSVIDSPFNRIIPRSISVLKYILLKTYLSLTTIDKTIIRHMDLIPNESLRRYFMDIVRIRSLGGDIHNYASEALSSLYISLKEYWTRIWRNITAYLEVIILLYGLLPSILSSLVFILGIRNVVTIFISLLIFYPFLSIAILFMIERMNVLDPISSRYSVNKYTVFLASLSPISLYLINEIFRLDLFTAASLWICITVIPNTIQNLRDWIEERRFEYSILNILTQMEELMNGGYSVIQSLKRVNLEGLNQGLIQHIRKILFLLDTGGNIGLNSGDERYKSYLLFKASLIEAIKSGGGLNEFISLKELLKSIYTVNGLRRFAVIVSVVTSSIVILMGVFSFSVVYNILSAIEYSNIPGFAPAYISILIFMGKLFILTGGIYTSLLLSKVLFGSFKNTIPLQFTSLTLLISYILIP